MKDKTKKKIAKIGYAAFIFVFGILILIVGNHSRSYVAFGGEEIAFIILCVYLITELFKKEEKEEKDDSSRNEKKKMKRENL